MPDARSESLNDPVRLSILRRLCLLDKAVDISFDRLTRLAVQILNTPVALVTFIDHDRQVFKSQIGLSESLAFQCETPLSHSFCQHVMASGEALIIEDARSHPLVCDNPAIEDFQVESYLGMPVTLSDGTTLGSFCVIDHKPRVWTVQEIAILNDLSKSVTTEIELRAEMLQRAEAEVKNARLILQQEQSKLLLEFFSNTSHDFRTPLAIINTSLDLLSRIQDREKQRHYIDRAQGQVSQLNQQIDNLHAYIKLHQINSLSLEQVDVNALAAIVMNRRLDHLNLSFVPADVPRIAGDTQLLHRLINELVDNAIKYTPAGGYVEVQTYASEQEVVIEVRDSGIGIAEDNLSHLFDMFYKIDSARNQISSGLGLTISKRIVDLHRGRIDVQSRLGHGSTFRVRLPV